MARANEGPTIRSAGSRARPGTPASDTAAEVRRLGEALQARSAEVLQRTTDRAAASEEIPARGEFVVVVGPAAVAGASRQAPQAAELEAAREQIARLRASGIPRGEATRQVAAATGLPRRHLYRERNE